MILNWLTGALAEGQAAAEAAPSWFETAFGEFANRSWWSWVVIAVLLVGGLLLYRRLPGGKKTNWNPKMLALGAVCIALSSVLSVITLMEMPQGGSITPASMLPLMLFAYVYGAGPGCMVGAVYGLLQFIIKPWFVSVPQVLLDYPIAYGVIGLTGLFSSMRNESLGLSLGVVVASAARYVAAVLSGVIFFADYAGSQNPWIYSLGYNIAYMLPECIICVVLCLLVGTRLTRELRKIK